MCWFCLLLAQKHWIWGAKQFILPDFAQISNFKMWEYSAYWRIFKLLRWVKADKMNQYFVIGTLRIEGAPWGKVVEQSETDEVEIIKKHKTYTSSVLPSAIHLPLKGQCRQLKIVTKKLFTSLSSWACRKIFYLSEFRYKEDSSLRSEWLVF